MQENKKLFKFKISYNKSKARIHIHPMLFQVPSDDHEFLPAQGKLGNKGSTIKTSQIEVSRSRITLFSQIFLWFWRKLEKTEGVMQP